MQRDPDGAGCGVADVFRNAQDRTGKGTARGEDDHFPTDPGDNIQDAVLVNPVELPEIRITFLSK